MNDIEKFLINEKEESNIEKIIFLIRDFLKKPPYHNGRATGFLTRVPSKIAQIIIDLLESKKKLNLNLIVNT